MISLKELKKGLLGVLRELFPDGYRFYGTEVVEGYEKPSFFTQLVPVLVEPQTQRVTDNIFLFAITCFQKKPDESDALEIISRIREAYGVKVQVGRRYINVESFSYEFVGNERNIPQIQVTVSFKDQIVWEEEREVMENVEWRYR